MCTSLYQDGTYLKKNRNWHTEDSSWKARQILKILNRNNILPKSIGEIGCGAGEILNQLYSKMPEDVVFTGYEISPQAFELCKTRIKKRLNFYLKDLLEDKKAFFDVVLCIDVLEHVEDYFSFLRNLKEKGDYKIFHIPLDLSVQTILRVNPILRARNKVGHIHYFTKELALEILKDTGYEILDYFYTDMANINNNITLKLLCANFLREMLFYLNEDIAVRILGGYSLLVLAK